MKSAAIPTVRVPPKLRHAAEKVLQSGETLSGLVEESVRRNVEFRQVQKEFVKRGLASAETAKNSGKSVSSASVLGKLTRRLEKSRNGGAVTA